MSSGRVPYSDGFSDVQLGLMDPRDLKVIFPPDASSATCSALPHLQLAGEPKSQVRIQVHSHPIVDPFL